MKSQLSRRARTVNTGDILDIDMKSAQMKVSVLSCFSTILFRVSVSWTEIHKIGQLVKARDDLSSDTRGFNRVIALTTERRASQSSRNIWA